MTDEDLMPFGKHKNAKMADVPASYFHYLWHNGIDKTSPVGLYIKDSMAALIMDTPNLIWDEN